MPLPGRAAESDFAFWPGLLTKLGTTERTSANLLLQVRLADDASEVQNTLVQAWFEARPRPWLELALGYSFIPLIEPTYVSQHRVWPQVTLSRRGARFAGSNRSRLELRFIEGLDPTAVRLRNGTRFTRTLGGGPWYVAVSDEVFFNLNDAGAIETGFAENRFFVGGGRKLDEQLRVESGYQMRFVDLPARDLIQHTLVLTLAFDAKLFR